MSRREWPQEIRRYGKDPVYGAFRQTAAERTPFNRHIPSHKLRAGISQAHLALVRKMGSAISHQIREIEAHHLKRGPARRERGVGRKSTDAWAVPLARWEHADLESMGSDHELAYFMGEGCINPYALARALICATGYVDRMHRVRLMHQLIASPCKIELESMGVTRLLPKDLFPITRYLGEDEWIDITPKQVVDCIARHGAECLRRAHR